MLVTIQLKVFLLYIVVRRYKPYKLVNSKAAIFKEQALSSLYTSLVLVFLRLTLTLI